MLGKRISLNIRKKKRLSKLDLFRLQASRPCALRAIHWSTSLHFSTIPTWARCSSPWFLSLVTCTTIVSVQRSSLWLPWCFDRPISSSLLTKSVWPSSKNSGRRVNKAMSSMFTRPVRVTRSTRKNISLCSGSMDATKCISFLSPFDPFFGYVDINWLWLPCLSFSSFKTIIPSLLAIKNIIKWSYTWLKCTIMLFTRRSSSVPIW